MARIAIHCTIHGRVQGVGYRAWARRVAAELGIDGWARNLPGGAVEAVFAGEEAVVARMIDACREGPGFARVTTIDQNPADDPGVSGFRAC